VKSKTIREHVVGMVCYKHNNQRMKEQTEHIFEVMVQKMMYDESYSSWRPHSVCLINVPLREVHWNSFLVTKRYSKFSKSLSFYFFIFSIILKCFVSLNDFF
jgi:hypothetical protein